MGHDLHAVRCVWRSGAKVPGTAGNGGMARYLSAHVEFVPLPISALHLISATKEMSDNAGMLAEILADGKIGTDELEEWEQLLHSVKEQIVACTQVLEAGADGK